MNTKALIRHLSFVLLSMSMKEAVLSAQDQVNAKPSCCQNGGICIMGSFCHCTSGFYGRYCEKELLYRLCGTLPHGTWIKAGCNACQCYDGNMICTPNRYSGCETAQWKTGIEENPTFTEGEAMDPELADDNYEYYYMYEEEHNGARRTNTHFFCTILILSTVYTFFVDS